GCIDPEYASVNTEIQTGPLYRAEGSRLSISCNVSGFKSEETPKIFDFRVTKPSRPNELNIISSGDKDFSYSIYLDRVRDGDISVKYVDPNSAIFEIESLLKDDGGEYDCTVRDTEHGYHGTYNAKIVVYVIDNSLSVSSSDPTSLSYDEGDALTLTCQASSNTIQHTHLSVAWYLRKDGEDAARPIISLDRFFTLIPGPGFEQRYVEGAVRLDKLGEATYILKMAQLELSDQGQIFCGAEEWIQDPDRTAQDSDPLSVKISSTGLMQDVPPTITQRDRLRLVCNVGGFKGQLSVTWKRKLTAKQIALFNIIVSLSQGGVMETAADFTSRNVRVMRPTDDSFVLELDDVIPSDSGVYRCTVTEWEPSGKSHSREQSANVTVIPIGKTPNILFILQALSSEPSISQIINSDVHINCRVTSKPSQSSQYAVTWLHQHDAANKTILSSDRKAVETLGSQTEQSFRQRVIMKRTNGPTFELTIRQARISDRGSYFCEVVEWLQDPRGDWYPLPGKSVITKLTVIEPGKIDNHLTVGNNLLFSFYVSYFSANDLTGNEVELECIMTSGAPAFFYKVIWFYAPPSFLSMNASLVELDQTGLLVYPENQALQSLQGRLRLSRPSQKNFYLKIQTAHETDSGTYWCQVEQYQLDNEGQWKQKASESSGPVTLAVNVAGMLHVLTAVSVGPLFSFFAFLARKNQDFKTKALQL
uniref:Immunoglobulin superfamily, member 3-like n=1 Tax=Nothobranchius furzeri TaxID=105023 RepID=A0A8C6LBM2_NOTFU